MVMDNWPRLHSKAALSISPRKQLLDSALEWNAYHMVIKYAPLKMDSAKSGETLKAAYALHFAHYNFCHIHRRFAVLRQWKRYYIRAFGHCKICSQPESLPVGSQIGGYENDDGAI